MQEAGVRLQVGTDSSRRMPFVIHGFALHRELQHLRDAGLRNSEILQAATSSAAAFLGQSDNFGAVRPGLRADLVLVRDNPLDDLRHLQSPEGVMIRGRWLSRERLAADLQRLVERRR